MTKNDFKGLVIACGGTGGHFYPGLAIAREFQVQGGKATLFLSGKHSVNQKKVAESFDIDSILIPSSPRSRTLKGMTIFLRDLIAGTFKARKAFKQLSPDAFLAMGSFASVPSALAAKSLKKPIFLHEGNARIGKANSLISRWSKTMAVAFPPVNEESSKAPIRLTGMPVRKELLESILPKEEAIEKINSKYNVSFKATTPTLFVFGGSQGTKAFNDIIPVAIANATADDIQIIHLTGTNKSDQVKKDYFDSEFQKIVLETSNDMHLFYQASDSVICRSGGSTLAELAIFAKFAVLVPYPHSADGHQFDNAEYQQKMGAARLVDNKNFTPAYFKSFIKEFTKDTVEFTKKGKAAKKIAMPNASVEVLSIIQNALAEY